ncbi:MAG TPA: amino acid adenylation domain-containing protein [Longimicrobium sp.]
MTDITSRLADLSPERRRLLALKLKQKAAAADAPAAVGERPSVFPASFAQRRLWLLDRLEPGSTAYSLPKVWRIPGPLDAAVLERALDELVRRHESLRTRLEERDGEPVQVIAPPSSFTLEMTDLSALGPDASRAELERLARADAATPFRLDEGPLFRASLVRLGDEEHALLWNLHHAVTDGWSTGILARELAALYGAFSRGEPSPLSPLPLQYGDHAVRERERLSGEALERLVGFWRGALAGAPTRLELPPDHPRPAERTHHGASVEAFLGDGITARVDALARAHDATAFMVYLAVFHLLLSRYTRQDEVLVGTAVANRATEDVEGIVGFFVNTLVLRGDLTGDPTFGELLARTRDATVAAFEHQALPFEKLVEELNPERSLTHAPLVQAVMVLHNQQSVGAPPSGSAEPALRLEAVGEGTEAARFDLSLDLVQLPDGVFVRLGYATDLLAEATVRGMLGHFAALLDAAAASPGARISTLPLIGEAEQAALVAAGSADALPVTQTLPALFAEQAAGTPDAVALAFGDETVTYAELDARANRLAHRLVKLGARPDALVGLFVERSIETVVAILAILKAGAAYLPLDPAYPEDRLAYMLGDSGAEIVVTTAALADRLPGGGMALVRLDADAEEVAAEPPDAPAIGISPDSLAYAIYTSGSTGTPKGVAVPQRAVVRLVRGAGFADLGPEQVFLQLAPMAFDASTLELWAPLLNGGRLAIAPPEAPSLREIAELVRRHGVTTLWLTAGLFHRMADEELDALGSLRQLLAGGDVLSVPHVRKVLQAHPRLRLINGYGPTENTTFTCCHTVGPGDAERASIPIGRPIAGTRAWVLDGAMRPCPAGVPGELYAGGEGVARGYLGRPAATAERFVPDPFSAEPGMRLYRTGDWARWTDVRECESAKVRECEGGTDAREATFAPSHSRTSALEFLGRIDQQVKVRGFRIEPGEVEAALKAHPGVGDAVVTARADGGGERRLVAYVVARGGGAPSAAELRAALAARLPDPMIPSAFVALDALPLTANGKVDRRALPAPEVGGDEDAYVPPRTPAEQVLAEIWAGVLGAGRVGLNDDFFALGGHSLLATQVVSRVREAFGVELPLRALFEAPRLGAFAEKVDAAVLGQAGADAPVTARGGNDLPLSFAQERLWFIDRLEPGSTAYNVAMPVRLGGALNVAALERALGELIRRHAALRTRFAVVDGAPVQRIEPAGPFRLEVDDISALAADEREAEIGRRAAAERQTPFDLEAGPLFRARLVRAGEGDHLLQMAFHHAITDGWSTGIFLRELTTLYAAIARGEPSPLAEPPVRYADFAAWQREWLRGERLEAQVAWWRRHLAGAPAVITLPTDRPRPPAQSHRGARIDFSIPAPLAEGLRAVALEQRATPFMALLASFTLLLSRWSGQDDVVVGTPVAGRTRREVEGVIGLFVNTLPIRTELAGDPTFRALLARVREATLGAYAHQDLPFERLVEELAPERSLSHAPVFQVMLTLQNLPEGPGEGFAELDARGVDGGQGTAKADLSLMLGEMPDGGIAGSLEYATDLFDEATAHRLADHLRTLIGAANAAPDAPVSTLSLLGDEERAALIAAGSATASFEVTDALPALFARQAARTPDAVAVTFGDESVAYAELDARANRLAHRLVKLGARQDTLVGLCIERSVETIVGILGILKSGAGYLPLDPAYPEDRLAYLLEDSGISVVVTTADLADRLGDGATLVRLDADAEAIAAEPSAAPEIDISPDSLAYVIYTSGSTGKPKGVEVTHANVARLFASTDHWFGFGERDVWTLFHSYAFDFSVWEIWGALLYGGRLVVVPFDVSRSPDEFYVLLERERVTVLNQTPSAFRQLMRADEVAAERGEMRDLALRCVVFGGEALDPATLRGWVERRGDESPRLVNMYGITETTVHVTYRVIRAGDTIDGSASPIGIPIPDLAVHLLDRHGQLVPTGVVGEMYVGGAGVARGYLHRPEMTAQRFVSDPFSAEPDARLYRSGDLARRLPDGSLDFQGRADEQVKIRGFRIEPGEIESVLLAHPAVREAVVLPRGEGEEKRLVAWIVATEGVDAAGLRAHLLARLPDYMVPAAFVFMDALPLTRHGKVDRRALPEPDAAALSGAGYVAPRTPTEELLAAVWAELLGAARVGVDDGFFELGGHSLLATRLASRVRESLGVELPVRAVFEHPTLGALAAEVDRLRRAAQGVETPPIRPVAREGTDLPLSFAQERLWFVDRMEAGSATYHMPLFARLEGALDADALRRALDELVRRHESLRTSFPLVDGLPVQRVAPPAPVELFTHDFAAFRDDEREEEAQRLVREHARIPFTLETGPLFRADLAKLGEREHLLLITLHHVIADGWSLDLLWRELAALYGAFSRGEPSPLAEPPVQYGDFAAWQRAWLQGEVLERQLAYWRRTLRGAPPLLKLPTDRPRPEVQTHNAATEIAVLPREQADAVLALARREGSTLFMVLLAALDVVLSRLAGDNDVVVGTPIAGRTRAETEGVVGLFLNSLALRVDLSGDPAFSALLRRVRETTLDAYAHQDVPFEAVLEEIHPERTLDRTPVFQVMLNLANFAAETGGAGGDLPGLQVRGVDRGGPLASKFDLTLYAGEGADGILLQLVYNPDLFDAARMQALLAQVAGVLEQAAADPARAVSALSLAMEEVAPGADRTVRTAAGAAAGVGELGVVWTRGADGAWRPTAERGRLLPDGAVEAVREEAEAAAAARSTTVAGRAPTETERVMLEIWRDVLKVAGIGLDDDFFDLGGHSLLGVRLVAQVKKRLKVSLPLTVLFAHPTPAGLAAAVDDAGKARDFHHLVPLTDVAAGSLPPLFLTHPAGGTVFRYRDLADRLGPARPVYALQAAGVSDGGEPLRSVDLMAGRYLEEVRRAQPRGPYHLAGWSAGGVTAVEMAHRLLAAGEEVAFVGMLDSSPPNADAEIPDPVGMYLRLAAGLSGAPGPVLEKLGDELAGLSIGERLEHLARWLAAHGAESRVGELDGLRPVMEVFRANVTAARRHVLAPYPGRLTLFCAEQGRGEGWEAANLPELWRPYAAGELQVEIVPGTHVNMIGEPHVDVLAEAIEAAIAGESAPTAAAGG